MQNEVWENVGVPVKVKVKLSCAWKQTWISCTKVRLLRKGHGFSYTANHREDLKSYRVGGT
jgi:hypothetical protein